MKGKLDHQAAAQEAYEEAGISGRIAEQPIGEYPYFKRLKSGDARPVVVNVFPLEVTAEHTSWPEKGQRNRQWMAPADAIQAVNEPALKILISSFTRARSKNPPFG